MRAVTAGAICLSLLSAGWLAMTRPWLSARAPGPAPSREIDPLSENARCEGCHVQIAAEWRSSQHQTARVDRVFQEAHGVEPAAFCRRCHAPEGEGERSQLGVGCVTCHRQGEAVAAGARRGVRLAPHPVDRRLEGDGACAGCHQFTFGDDEAREQPLAMQRTVDEHRASPHADKSCASCHMPVVGEGSAAHRSHAFSSTRDVEAHRRAVEVTASRPSAGAVRLCIKLHDVGHAYPTGDLFRRLSIEATAVGEDQRAVASQTRYLTRRYGVARGPDGRPQRVEVSDDRPGASGPQPEVVVDLALGEGAEGRPIAWRVALDRVLHVNDGRDDEAVVDSSIVIATGELGPLACSPRCTPPPLPASQRCASRCSPRASATTRHPTPRRSQDTR